MRARQYTYRRVWVRLSMRNWMLSMSSMNPLDAHVNAHGETLPRNAVPNDEPEDRTRTTTD
jgi:hypothetical protein